MLPSGNPQARTALPALCSPSGYVREYPNSPKPGLLFLGAPAQQNAPGRWRALRGLIAKGFEGIFYDFQSLLTRIHKGYDKASGRAIARRTDRPRL